MCCQWCAVRADELKMQMARGALSTKWIAMCDVRPFPNAHVVLASNRNSLPKTFCLTTEFNTRNSSWDENSRTWSDLYRLICLLTYVYPYISTEPEAVLLGIKLTKVNWRHLNLNLILHNIYSTLMCGLRIFGGPLIGLYHHRLTSYLRLLALSIILTCSPNISYLARLVSDNFRSLKKLSPATPKEKNCLRSCSRLSTR